MTTLRLEFNQKEAPRATRAPLGTARQMTPTSEAGDVLPKRPDFVFSKRAGCQDYPVGGERSES